MRVGINALYLLPGRVGGSEVYLRNLIKWLPRVAPGHEFLLYVNTESAGLLGEEGIQVVRCKVRASNRPMRIAYEQTVLPLLARRDRLDALFSAGMTAPFFSPVPSFVMVYDLQHVNQPGNFNRWYLLFLKSIIYMSAKSAHAVLTLSEKSKRDIVKFYSISPDKVTVTHLASEKSVFMARPPEEAEDIRRKYGLPPGFVLYIASSLPHKNYERLLKAFKLVKISRPDLKLVLIGSRDYGHEAIRGKISELGLEEDIIFLGWLPYEDIPLVYSAAGLFVFPSLHEGFGIPVLEAMASGVPVVCSCIEPLDEVAGDAALFVDPLSVESIAHGMLRVLEDPALRKRLAAEGLRRSAGFSWERTALQTFQAISGAISRPGA